MVDAGAAGEWRLGDIAVRRLGFGAKRLPLDRDRAIAVLRRAVELGVNHIDTASFYPNDAPPGLANQLIRQALAPYPDDLVIATKVGPLDEGLARPDQLRGLVEANLRELGLDQLDVVNLRQAGLDSVAEHVGELAQLRAEGLIRQLGLSNVRPAHLAQAQAIAPVVCVQNRYAVDFGRVNDDLLRTCGEQAIAFVPFFALAGEGREAGGVADTEAVREVARAHDATPAQVRLAWILHRGPHVLAIPGTSHVEHLAENVAAGALRLSAEELARLE
ncbi:MAG: aldo/keto reductase [Betaproteobacteria bacterium]